MDERRQYQRIPFAEAVRIEIPAKDLAIVGRALDLSARGISLQSDQPLWPGQRCTVEFKIPGKTRKRKITLECESWHCGHGDGASGYRIGMLFLKETSSGSGTIAKFVQAALEGAEQVHNGL